MYKYLQIRHGLKLHIATVIGGQPGNPICGKSARRYYKISDEPFGAVCFKCADMKQLDRRK